MQRSLDCTQKPRPNEQVNSQFLGITRNPLSQHTHTHPGECAELTKPWNALAPKKCLLPQHSRRKTNRNLNSVRIIIMITLRAAGKEDKCDGVRVSECASVSVCLVNTLQFFVAMESHFPLLSPLSRLDSWKSISMSGHRQCSKHKHIWRQRYGIMCVGFSRGENGKWIISIARNAHFQKVTHLRIQISGK